MIDNSGVTGRPRSSRLSERGISSPSTRRGPSDAFGVKERLQQRPRSRVSAAHRRGVHSQVPRDLHQRESIPVDEADDLLIDRLELGDRSAHIGGMILLLGRAQLREVPCELVRERMPTRMRPPALRKNAASDTEHPHPGFDGLGGDRPRPTPQDDEGFSQEVCSIFAIGHPPDEVVEECTGVILHELGDALVVRRGGLRCARQCSCPVQSVSVPTPPSPGRM